MQTKIAINSSVEEDLQVHILLSQIFLSPIPNISEIRKGYISFNQKNEDKTNNYNLLLPSQIGCHISDFKMYI